MKLARSGYEDVFEPVLARRRGPDMPDARELVVKPQRDNRSMMACEALSGISRLAMLWVDTCFPEA